MSNLILLFVRSFGKKKNSTQTFRNRLSLRVHLTRSPSRQTIAQVYCLSPSLSVSSGLQLQQFLSGERP
ncbi:hypothetical protein ACI65C_007425 [Semiaphis heraclei]